MSKFFFLFIIILSFYKTSKANFICPESNGLFPDPLSCENFYECDKFSPYLKSCGSNLHFNPIQKYCDWPEGANCRLSNSHKNLASSTTQPTISSTKVFSDSSIIVITKKPKKPTKITQPTTRFTESTTKFTQYTAKFTTQYTTKPIKPKENTTSKPLCEFCFKCPQANGYFENNLDKFTYYHCFKNESFLMYCPRNYIWIQLEQICKEEEEIFLIDARIKPKTGD